MDRIGKYTPGPWKAEPSPKIVDQEGNDILASYKPASHPDCQLLAAAPELLEALQDFTDAEFDKHHSLDNHDPSGCRYCNAVTIIEKITKTNN